jgi:transcriptional regulator with XRE-family HTH domain
MGSTERRRDRGRRAADRVLRLVATEIRDARLMSGASQRVVADTAGMSHTELSRIERGEAPWLTVDALCRIAAVVGLDPSLRLYPTGPALRDAPQRGLLGRFHVRVHPSLMWATEVPIRGHDDLRAWDALITGPGFRVAVEAETRLHDIQALERRIALKVRDGGIDRVALVVADTRQNRAVLSATGKLLAVSFPVPARQFLEALSAGRDPGGSGIVCL